MKIKVFKRVGALFLAFVMMTAVSTTAFAADTFITTSVSVPANSTVKTKIGTLSSGETGSFKIQSSGLDGKTFNWSINKGSNPAFMSGTTYINDVFVQNYYYMAAGTYYATITNNSSHAITVIITFEW